ncbi:MAG: UDP-N-acetylmuramate dehydrogenase [Bacteroidota bacterium]|jgi:UDP-N-acetylmuramate dehydrogenase
MIIEHNISLKHLNTFGIEVYAKEFVVIKSYQDLQALISQRDISKEKFLIIGGGSNILFTKDFGGLLIKMEIEGVELVREDEKYVWIKASAGLVWHDFVLYTIEKGWGGLENLSLIPGTVGASPIQNIGAYGVEVKDVIEEVMGVNLYTKQNRTIKSNDCQFEYRSSIFKRYLKNKFLITNVIFKLSKRPKLHIEYGAIKDELKKENIEHPTIKDVSTAVINIRRSKLPDPAVLGNAGSFFKNPVVDQQKLSELKSLFPTIVSYPFGGQFKLAAGWLIEHAGWKGYRRNNVGCHEKQALVLVNFGGANGDEILRLSNRIKKSIKKKFGVNLIEEVNIIQ